MSNLKFQSTIRICLVDAGSNRLVWEAVVQGEVSVKDLEDAGDRIRERVPKYFAKYPFTAGSDMLSQR